jgi:cell division protein FtsW (lipid II flippase)
MFKTMNPIEKIAFPLIGLYLLMGAAIAMIDPSYFTLVVAKEDGPIEWLTVLGLVLSFIVCLHRVATLKSDKSWVFIGVWSFLALLTFFGAGEEISWGQRIFNVESSEWFLQNNAQAETNLHNLVVDGKKINKIIFSAFLGLALLTYLFVFSIAYRRSDKFKGFCEYFSVPIAQWHHVAAWVAVAVVAEVFIKGVGRSSELFESAAVFVFLLNISYPYNGQSFKKVS